MGKANIVNCWTQIELWLLANAPDVIPLLPAGASPADFTQAEQALGFSLPEDVRAFLSAHDGSAGIWLHDRGAFMSLSDILSAWEQEVDLWGDGDNDEWATPSGPIRKKWFAREWLPILDAMTGDYVCADLDPAKGGRRGQLIDWHHDGGPRSVVAQSYTSLLSAFIAELKQGCYVPKRNRADKPYLEYLRKTT